MLPFCNLVKSTWNQFRTNAFRGENINWDFGRCDLRGFIVIASKTAQTGLQLILTVIHQPTFFLSGNLPWNIQYRACLEPENDPFTPTALQSRVGVYLRPILSPSSSLRLSVLYGLCCGAVTSLSPRCHPAGEGFRRARPLPKPHSATSAIHKRQPLSLS